MEKYVVGFVFDQNGKVILLRKTHPDWQAGKLNGVGGKCKPGEDDRVTMVREWQEEVEITNPLQRNVVVVPEFRWAGCIDGLERINALENNTTFSVDLYSCILPNSFSLYSIKALTEEKVEIVSIHDKNLMENDFASYEIPSLLNLLWYGHIDRIEIELTVRKRL